MSSYGAKNIDPAFQANVGYKVTPDEIDRYEIYHVIYPSVIVNGTVGTAAAGTSTQSKAMVVVNRALEYPRNLLGVVVGTSDMGGTWVVNGKDQFGVSITESIAIGSAANGGTTAGTMVFAEVTSGTFNFSTAVGNGTPALRQDVTGTTVKFGLPFKINSATDVKSITWTNELVPTPINNGTIAAYVGTGGNQGYNNWFRGTADVAGTQTYTVVARPTWNASSDTAPQAGR